MTKKMTSKSNKNERLATLFRQQEYLLQHGTDTRYEIQQLKIALRITQQRTRRIKAQIKRELEGRPPLRLVHSAS